MSSDQNYADEILALVGERFPPQTYSVAPYTPDNPPDPNVVVEIVDRITFPPHPTCKTCGQRYRYQPRHTTTTQIWVFECPCCSD